VKEQLRLLRQKMKVKNIDVYLVVSDDFHGSEYVGDYFKCREFLTGFTGSAGSVVITQTSAGLFTDGRYFLQAMEQLQGTGIELFKQGEKGVPSIPEYLNSQLTNGQCLGFDGRTINKAFVEALRTKFQGKAVVISGDNDLVGDIWEDRPAISRQTVWELDMQYTGQSRVEKVAKIRDELLRQGVDYHIISSLTDIAWIFNLRGGDVKCCPVFLAYALITKEEQIIFAHRECFSTELVEVLLKDGVRLRKYEEVYQYLSELGQETKHNTAVKILLDSKRTNYALTNVIDDSFTIVDATDPSIRLKAVKNETEIINLRKAHIEDGIAVTKFLYWLKTNIGKEDITEISAAKQLATFRARGEGYLEESFAPIFGYQEHGAIVHYSATCESDAKLMPDGLLLMDTGGHYLYGSTDVTRTITLGNASAKQRQHYTAVLKGQLRLSMARFLSGCVGSNLDYLARGPLWALGLDYKHGTGHGVGYLLSIHEGPQTIRFNARSEGEVPFLQGMVTSNEPGVYIAGEYGIRLENLMLCQASMRSEYGQFMEFETLTMIPFDLDCINRDDLSVEEQQYLNQYHEKVREAILPHLNQEEGEWLLKATAKV